MTDNFIQLEKGNIFRIGIKDENGNFLKKVLEFDFEDSGVLLKYQDMMEKIKKDKSWLNNQYLIIGKRQDVRGKKLLSKNEEDKFRAEQEFFKRIVEDYNMFLGTNGIETLLNGRNVSFASLIMVDEIIEKQILPLLEKYQNKIDEDIKKKYLSMKKVEEEIEVIE